MPKALSALAVSLHRQMLARKMAAPDVAVCEQIVAGMIEDVARLVPDSLLIGRLATFANSANQADQRDGGAT